MDIGELLKDFYVFDACFLIDKMSPTCFMPSNPSSSIFLPNTSQTNSDECECVQQTELGFCLGMLSALPSLNPHLCLKSGGQLG